MQTHIKPVIVILIIPFPFIEAFYDCAANNFDKQFMITGFPHCIISMDYWYVYSKQ